VTDLDDVLALCPVSDSEQLRVLGDTVGLRTLRDLSGAVVFGTGALGVATAGSLRDLGLQPSAFSDNDALQWGRKLNGLYVIPPADLHADTPIVIASKYVKDIEAGLTAAGHTGLVPHYVLSLLFPDAFRNAFHVLSAETIAAASEDIAKVSTNLADLGSRELFAQLLRFRITLAPADLPNPTPDQYFPPDIWHLSAAETYVDAGACGGDTLAEFLRRSNGVFARYYAFEPDSLNLEKLRRYASELSDPRIVVLPYGVGDRHELVTFLGGKGGESRIVLDGPMAVELVTLDSALGGEPVTAVKIDVEGYEREVIRGARTVLAERSPKLAVSVYHHLEDLWEIPALVRACHAGYAHYLRHHTHEIYDTVLYCVPPVVS
jgi:FkbM family methyltransferase